MKKILMLCAFCASLYGQESGPYEINNTGLYGIFVTDKPSWKFWNYSKGIKLITENNDMLRLAQVDDAIAKKLPVVCVFDIDLPELEALAEELDNLGWQTEVREVAVAFDNEEQANEFSLWLARKQVARVAQTKEGQDMLSYLNQVQEKVSAMVHDPNDLQAYRAAMIKVLSEPNESCSDAMRQTLLKELQETEDQNTPSSTQQ